MGRDGWRLGRLRPAASARHGDVLKTVECVGVRTRSSQILPICKFPSANLHLFSHSRRGVPFR
ncbi:hypothetical protein Sp245p_28170 (plasmid) [Azospirillum baldaniorum]|uniref:Uncharacterized protein n=1 Tax=Azospirillum baldaniorum TaxID=1064539 RepID=A0A9P1NQB8_9PROT|nr:hypothetical protein Sp245p_28170 [Azospirillum baldaniorum]CCD01832.1 protein of unknown function [Azospirillum baldaniorum]